MKYVQGLAGNAEKGECFICHDVNHPEEDDENLILWRTPRCIVLLNRYSYNNGHMLIAPIRHIADLGEANDEELFEMMQLVRECQNALSAAIKPHGFNVGMNLSRCAGAGLPGHLHIHVVPRWNGDCNFMNVCSNTDVISQSLVELLAGLKRVSCEGGLPKL